MASLSYCKSELNSIIRELESIEWDVRQSAYNVGEDKCANTVKRIVSRLRSAKYILDHVDTNRLADWVNGD